MAKKGRLCCLGVPVLLTLASMVLVIIIFTADTTASMDKLYFLKFDTTDFRLKSVTDVDDFYTIGLFNYCSGKNGDSHTFCSPKSIGFWFDPISAWHLTNTVAESLLYNDFKNGLGSYETDAKIMFAFYVVALAGLAISLPLSIWAYFSRIGTFIYHVTMHLGHFGLLIATGIATRRFISLRNMFVDDTVGYDIDVYLGKTLLGLSWLAYLLSLIAGLFSLLAICFCRPEQRKGAGGKRNMSEKQGFQVPGFGSEKYQRVPSPYMGAGATDYNNGHDFGGGEHDSMPPQGWKGGQSAYPPRDAGYEPYRQA